jgi:hypothetical protein
MFSPFQRPTKLPTRTDTVHQKLDQNSLHLFPQSASVSNADALFKSPPTDTPTRRHADTLPLSPRLPDTSQFSGDPSSGERIPAGRPSAIRSIPLSGSSAERGDRLAHLPGSRGSRPCRSKAKKRILSQVQKPITGASASTAAIGSFAGGSQQAPLPCILDREFQRHCSSQHCSTVAGNSPDRQARAHDLCNRSLSIGRSRRLCRARRSPETTKTISETVKRLGLPDESGGLCRH